MPEDRSVRLENTVGGAGVLSGDLTPPCAAVVTTVLDALSAPAGAADTRSHDQLFHDALEEAMRQLGKCIVIASDQCGALDMPTAQLSACPRSPGT